MDKYKEFELVETLDGFMALSPVEYDPAFAVLNFDGNLATSTKSIDAIFDNKEDAKELVKYLASLGVLDVYIDNVFVKGEGVNRNIRIPIKRDLALPEEEPFRQVAKDVLYAALEVLGKAPYTGGCYTFYTTEEWRERKEEYGIDSELIIVHDGGEFSTLCNYGYCEYTLMEAFTKELKKKGYYIEQCTCWYSAVYKIEN